jgi:hypothetical protein
MKKAMRGATVRAEEPDMKREFTEREQKALEGMDPGMRGLFEKFGFDDWDGYDVGTGEPFRELTEEEISRMPQYVQDRIKDGDAELAKRKAAKEQK